MTIIYAANIHTGGGKVLLEALLRNLDADVTLFHDARLPIGKSHSPRMTTVAVKPSLLGRLAAEFSLRSRAKAAQRVLCFGNLPPLFQLGAPTDLFFQNTILLKKYSDFEFSLAAKLKHRIERAWLRWGVRHIRNVYVQSNSTKHDFLDDFPETNVVVAPFILPLVGSTKSTGKKHDFVYVASGDPHKNHDRLLTAWELLAQKNIFPTLALTISDSYPVLLSRIRELASRGLRITNQGSLPHAEVAPLYQQARALIFPSFTESFGLPLLEAKGLELDIVASELDFVREVVSPVETFDPRSEVSIARAVARYLGKSMEGSLPLMSPEDFFDLLQR